MDTVKSIIIDRVEWNLFLLEQYDKICEPFLRYLLQFNSRILEYETTHKCVVMNVTIYSSDVFWEHFLKNFTRFDVKGGSRL